jgi:hypothetical protein
VWGRADENAGLAQRGKAMRDLEKVVRLGKVGRESGVTNRSRRHPVTF